jgi:hypothetical protein
MQNDKIEMKDIGCIGVNKQTVLPIFGKMERVAAKEF